MVNLETVAASLPPKSTAIIGAIFAGDRMKEIRFCMISAFVFHILFLGDRNGDSKTLSDKRSDYFITIEILLGQRAREKRMLDVIATRQLDALCGIAKVAEAQQASAIRQPAATTCVLHYGRLPGCEVAEGAVADPCILQQDA